MWRPRPSITSGSFSSLITRVSTGVRPGGISSIRLTSISPYWVSVSVRGIGVAVITSRCGGCSALDDEQQPLRHAEAVLLVDHREAELLVGDLLLEDRVGADEDVDRAVGEAHQHAVARPALLAAGEDRDAHADAVELAEQGRMMLAGEDFGRREQRRLRAGFDRGEHRQQRDQRLARADVALEQAQHRRRLRHVAADFLDHAPLRAGQLVGQLELAVSSPVPASGVVRCRRCDWRSSSSASWLAKISS